ncbi:hypothetical protein [Paenibacillus sp. MMS18-CY102]|uniref:hypothetical protein n=1 Tax=Paenibacillus sp. MMS18-CY102 TaxID=2682849 RepID=UPI0013667C09|nr:hypothetical protein [Paenibacillus sp. MMS18-CY102]MWC29194.1 hypothetical protein [Paenibacillus sp. MMS18-CY102]
MPKLSRSQFNKAKNFIMDKSRKLDRAMFEFEFENGSKESVLAELRAYQNSDGGFGNAIEPDFRCNESSALGTTVALQYLSRIHADENTDMVKQAVSYLLRSAKKLDSYYWEIVPKEVETAPRAPWWNYNESRPFTGNPNAEIIGYLHEFRGLVSSDMLNELTTHILNYIDDLHEPEFHELLCFLTMVERLPLSLKERLSEKIAIMVQKCVTIQPDLWQNYCLQPIQVVQSPNSPYYKMFKEALTANLDYLVAKQTEDGCWNPAWAWGQFEDAWQHAKVEWQGWLTLDYLNILRQHDYIEM